MLSDFERFGDSLGQAPVPEEALIAKGDFVEPSVNGHLIIGDAAEYQENRRMARFVLTSRRRIFSIVSVDPETGRKTYGRSTVEGRLIPREHSYVSGTRRGRWYADGGWNRSIPRSVLLAASLGNPFVDYKNEVIESETQYVAELAGQQDGYMSADCPL